MERRGSDWRSILLVLGASAGALLAFISVAGMLAYSAMGGQRQTELLSKGSSTLSIVVLASALVLIGATMLPSVYYGVQKLRTRAVPTGRLPAFKVWQAVLLVLAWLAAAAGAGLLVDKPVTKWVTPLLFIVAIAIPVYFFARLATGGLQAGSRERTWGALAAGIELGVVPAMMAELGLALVAVVGVSIYIAFHPGQLAQLQQLVRQLQDSNGLEEVLKTVGPALRSPMAFIGAIVAFSILSPIIEETCKSLAAWVVFDKLSSPAQGFAIGALSGAAFGLVESLLVSSTPDSSWTTTLLVRGASTMMHIMGAGLTGWGIGQFRTSRNLPRLIGMYLAAMALHGSWNASVVAITFGSLRNASKAGVPDLLSMLLILAGAVVLVLLCLMIPIGMGLINWRLRMQEAPADSLAQEVPWALVPSPRRQDDDAAPRATDTNTPTEPPTPPA